MITRRGGNTTWTMSLLSTLVFDFGFARNRAFSAFPTHKNYGYWDVPATHWWAWWANWPQHCHSPGSGKRVKKSILSSCRQAWGLAGFCRFQATKTRIDLVISQSFPSAKQFSHSQSREALGKGNLNWGPSLNFVSPKSCQGGMDCCTRRRGNVGFLLNFLGTGWIPAPHEGETTRRLSWRILQ